MTRADASLRSPHALQNAVDDLLALRRGEAVMPESVVGRLLDIVERAAELSGRTAEDVIATAGADPRLDAPACATPEEQALDLGEIERIRYNAERCRLERAFRRSTNFDESLLPALWNVAHSIAITEVANAVRRSALNEGLSWNETTWRRPDGDGPKA